MGNGDPADSQPTPVSSPFSLDEFILVPSNKFVKWGAHFFKKIGNFHRDFLTVFSTPGIIRTEFDPIYRRRQFHE